MNFVKSFVFICVWHVGHTWSNSLFKSATQYSQKVCPQSGRIKGARLSLLNFSSHRSHVSIEFHILYFYSINSK